MKRLSVFVLLSAGLWLIALQAVAQSNLGPERVGLFPDSPPYALHGPNWVGTREFLIGAGSERAIAATLWYPALNVNTAKEAVTYSYTSALFRPASVIGHAIADPYPYYGGGPYPLVVVSHGTDMNRFNLNYLSEHLASHGFVVIAANHTGNATGDAQFPFRDYTDGIAAAMVHRPRDVARQIDYAGELSSKSGALPGLIDLQHVAVIGHSYGGYAALAAAGARVNLTSSREWCASVAKDPAITAGFGYVFVCNGVVGGEEKELAMLSAKVKPGDTWPAFDVPEVKSIVLLGSFVPFGPQSFDKVKLPVLAIAGTSDSLYNANKWLYETLPTTRKAFFTLDNASHEILAQCDEFQKRLSFPCGYSEQVWDQYRVQDRIRHVSTAFLLYTLKGNVEALKALMPGAITFPSTHYDSTLGVTGK